MLFCPVSCFCVSLLLVLFCGNEKPTTASLLFIVHCRSAPPRYAKGYPALPEDETAGSFDIVLANILAGVLFRLPATLFRALKPGGKLLLSGMMKFQIERLLEAYRDHFDVRVVVSNCSFCLFLSTCVSCALPRNAMPSMIHCSSAL